MEARRNVDGGKRVIEMDLHHVTRGNMERRMREREGKMELRLVILYSHVLMQ